MIIYYLSLWTDILEDNENTSVLYPTINGVQQRLTLFDRDFDMSKGHVVKDLMIRTQSYMGRTVKKADPTRTNPEGVVGYELYKITHLTVKESIHLLRTSKLNMKKYS